MATFHLWNGYLEADRVEIDVTRPMAPSARDLDDPWAGACLLALGLPVAARAWALRPVRASYLSEDPGSEEWEDRWPRAFVLGVRLDAPTPAWQNELRGGYVPLETSHAPWLDEPPDPAHDRAALLVADFRADPAAVERAAADAIRALARELPGSTCGTAIRSLLELDPPSRLAHGEAGGHGRHTGNYRPVHQARILVTGIGIPDAIPALEAVLGGLRAAGGATDWRSSGEG
jgi:hypothetical protein